PPHRTVRRRSCRSAWCRRTGHQQRRSTTRAVPSPRAKRATRAVARAPYSWHSSRRGRDRRSHALGIIHLELGLPSDRYGLPALAARQRGRADAQNSPRFDPVIASASRLEPNDVLATVTEAVSHLVEQVLALAIKVQPPVPPASRAEMRAQLVGVGDQ